MSADRQRVEAVLTGAAALGDGQARAAYLNETCAGDEELRREVESLLEAHDEAGTFLEGPAPGAPLGVPPSGGPGGEPAEAGATNTGQPGDRIGRYRLLEKIGEGGMGSVWMAEQEEPVRRRVALKVIKLGMDTREVIARFEAERQALALMDHPNIAKIHDGGVTGDDAQSRAGVPPAPTAQRPDENAPSAQGRRDARPALPAGRPYFVMELVRGIRITDYCDQHRLSTAQRLDLFTHVCHAVQHAHQKGIIHRDLKPSNVLVTVNDGVPVPKVIDFGIAKATDQQLTELTDKTVFTRFMQFMGTPAYMSPEQAELTSLDIDTRSDIYSLGVLLYELLTGHTPFDSQELLAAGLDEMRRVILETEPPRPSTRFTDLVAADARRRLQEVRGDLDWIVMKCIEKDRTRRYDTADGLASDLERYLHDEPVLARPPSTGYRLRKFARKHRTAVTVAAGFLLLLATAAVVSTALALWANRERSKAVEARNDATTERTRAIHAEAEAAEKARQAETVSTFLVDTFRRPDPSKDGRDVKVVDLLEQAVRNLEKEFTGTSRTKGNLMDVLGRTYEGLGLYARAVELHETALKLRQAEFGPDHPETLASMNELAKAYHAAGRLSDALKLFQEALKLAQGRVGGDHPDALTIVNNLARTLHRLGRLDEAIALFEQTYERRKAALGDTHLHTLTTLHNLALAYQDAGQVAKALPFHEEAHRLFDDTVGPRHPSTLAAANDLARVYKAVGRLDDAIRLHTATLEIRKDVLGDDHPLTLSSLHNLALTYLDSGQPTNALPLHEAAHRAFREKLGARNSETLSAANDLARAYQAVGRLDEAIRLHEETLGVRRDVLGDNHRLTLSSMHNLALACQADQRLDKALPLAEEAVRRGKEKLARGHRYTLAFLKNLAALYQQLGRTNDALTHWRELLDIQRDAPPDDRVPQAETLSLIGEILLAQRQFDQAAPLLRESVTILSAQQPGRTEPFEAQALLGWAMLEVTNYSEAERFLLRAYEGLNRPEAGKPPPAPVRLLKETAERLVRLYEASDKPDKAAEWRLKLR